MTDARLRHIQSLQYTDKAAAESALLDFIRETFPQLDPAAVELRPSAVSLNSFNGYLTLSDGKRLFFKTHVEPDSIVGEYYNSQLLADAGYPIIRPLYASTEYGKQFLIYDLIEWPSVFDVVYQQESTGEAQVGSTPLAIAQANSDKQLLEIYLNTLAWQNAENATKAPIHQLFYHRLAGKRYQDFYQGEQAKLPLDKIWVINDRCYQSNLRDLIANQTIIVPEQEGLSVIGHGDAHNGNIFLRHIEGMEEYQLVYFDPAFAGRHNPFLDLAKPLFHNVFASWLYHPIDHPQAKTLIRRETSEKIHITFDENLLNTRWLFFHSKAERVLKPLVIELRRRDLLPANWRLYLKTALFCCPLLTMDLTDANRFPENVKWLGLAYSVIMGSESKGSEKSILDKALDEIEAEL